MEDKGATIGEEAVVSEIIGAETAAIASYDDEAET